MPTSVSSLLSQNASLIRNDSQQSQLILKVFDMFFAPLRHWIDAIEIQNPQTARLFCRLIPAQCPFERDIIIAGRAIAHIPPLCKLNPLYEQLVGLRFRSLCYLADHCGEDVQAYI